MSISYLWMVSRMDCVPSTPAGNDYVNAVYWLCIANDGTYSSRTYGVCQFEIKAEPDFVPYANLTEIEVLQWCWTNSLDKDAIETNLAAEIDAQANPPVVTLPLPWSN